MLLFHRVYSFRWVSLSDRKEQSLTKVNCVAIPENLMESEFFGHEKGAFVGAYKRSIGRIEAAYHGTFFLDEVDEIPYHLQDKLLRFLQSSEIK